MHEMRLILERPQQNCITGAVRLSYSYALKIFDSFTELITAVKIFTVQDSQDICFARNLMENPYR
jgi:hypothetical protein